jgi:hypothetical protein
VNASPGARRFPTRWLISKIRVAVFQFVVDLAEIKDLMELASPPNVRVPPCLHDGARGHCVEAEGFGLSLGALGRLAQDEEPGLRRGDA